MSRITSRVVQSLFVVAIAGALAFGGHAAFAADRALQCECDPDDPGRDDFCVECCMAGGSMCPLGGGSEPRECLCA